MPVSHRFPSEPTPHGELQRARHIRRLEVAFEAEPELAALVADLLEELDSLRAQLRRLAP